MGSFKTVKGESVRQTLEEAASGHTPVSVTVHHRGRWMTLRSWLIAQYGDFLWLDGPCSADQPTPHAFQPGDKLSVKFRRGSRQYVLSARAVNTEPYVRDDGTRSVALKVTSPQRMQVAEPRTHARVRWPAHRVGQVVSWLPGRDDRGDHALRDGATWSGRILDLSSGGVNVRSDHAAVHDMASGDLVILRMDLGQEAGDVVVDARLRHTEPDGDTVLLGFEFVENPTAPRARAGLAKLRELVREVDESENRPALAHR